MPWVSLTLGGFPGVIPRRNTFWTIIKHLGHFFFFLRSSDSFFFLYWFFFNKYFYYGHFKKTVLLFQIRFCVSLCVYLMVNWKKLYKAHFWAGGEGERGLRPSLKKSVVISASGRKKWTAAFFSSPNKTLCSVQTMNMFAVICTIWSLWASSTMHGELLIAVRESWGQFTSQG